jgi:hypothetical protein
VIFRGLIGFGRNLPQGNTFTCMRTFHSRRYTAYGRVSVFRLPVNHGCPMKGGYASGVLSATDD